MSTMPKELREKIEADARDEYVSEDEYGYTIPIASSHRRAYLAGAEALWEILEMRRTSDRTKMVQALNKIEQDFASMSDDEFAKLVGGIDVSDEEASRYAVIERAVMDTAQIWYDNELFKVRIAELEAEGAKSHALIERLVEIVEKQIATSGIVRKMREEIKRTLGDKQ